MADSGEVIIPLVLRTMEYGLILMIVQSENLQKAAYVAQGLTYYSIKEKTDFIRYLNSLNSLHLNDFISLFI